MADAIAEVERLGGISIAAHIERGKTGFERFAAGYQNWKKDIVTSAGLYGLECDSVDALVWYSENDEPGSAGVERKRIFMGRKAVRELSARYHLAHIQGSDSHSMNALEHQDPNKPWTRMKLAELSFDAFRIALIDPTARVRACALVPNSIPRVRGLAITGGFLHEEKIHFSDNLNCLIGGRGTGKSTAIRALAYAFGLNDDFGDFDNCPDSVVVYCEDENGIPYRYTRSRGGEIEVKAKADGSVNAMPIDAFRIEYFGQGELAKVAEDPLKNPEMFQEFLDRHTSLRDLVETEETLVSRLRENAGRLNPLESAFQQLGGKKKSLEEIEKKLKLGEEGNLREIVGTQSKLASEKTVRESVESIAADFTKEWTFSNVYKDFDQLVATAGVCTDDDALQRTRAAIKAALVKNNAAVKQKEIELNALLKACAREINGLAQTLKVNHQRIGMEVAAKIADLKSRGLASDIPGLELLLRQKTAAGREIAAVEQRAGELRQCQNERAELRKKLAEVRTEMTTRRKAQLRGINSNLGVTIRDYTIFLKYDDAGITTEFRTFLQQKMQGTYLQDNVIASICDRITPSDLADLVLNRDSRNIAATAQISEEWAEKIIDKLCYWGILFELQALAKPPKPVITVRTKSTPPKDIPVLQLSDGQRHTILLTIAMLADSNVPLVIDQPEDDLDNAFIFSSIVTTLRAIKEKRQVIVVTHNANIAVLGDSELILPMHRENDRGKTKDRGSIDASLTRRCVIDILEGGPDAFMRRKEMYNH
jgi:DNA repair ATPase RecN